MFRARRRKDNRHPYERSCRVGMVKEGKRRRNPIGADRLFHVRIAEASGIGVRVLVLRALRDRGMGRG